MSRFVWMLMLAGLLAAIGCEQKPADRTPGKVTSEDVRRDADQAVKTAEEYSQQTKEEFQKKLEAQLKKQTDFETFFEEAPHLNASRTLIKGVICGVRVEDIKEPTMREIRYLDKLVDELAKGKPMEKILRE